MNKIFKIVWNAARGKMMVVNEATSSVQTGKKAAVTVAVIGALASGVTMAATELNESTGMLSSSETEYFLTKNVELTVLHKYGGEPLSIDLKGNTFTLNGHPTNKYDQANHALYTGKDTSRSISIIDTVGNGVVNLYATAGHGFYGASLDHGIQAKTLNVISNANNGLAAAGTLTLEVDVEDLTISAGYNGLQASENSQISVEAREVAIDTAATGLRSANNGKLTITADDLTVTSDKNAIKSEGDSKVVLDATNVSLKSNTQAAVLLDGNANLVVTADKAVFTTDSDYYGIDARGSSTATINANVVEIYSEYAGVLSRGSNSNVTLGNEESSLVKIEAKGQGWEGKVIGLWAYDPGSSITVKGQNLEVVAKGDEGVTSYGILAQPRVGAGETGDNRIVVEAQNTLIDADTGILAMSKGQVDVKGNLTVNATNNAILARGESTVNINQAGGKDVVLNGDINFNKDASSNTNAWADVNVTLDTAGSVWNGNVKATWNEISATAEDFKNSKLNLTLANGAQWNPQAIAAEGTLGQATTYALRRSGPTDSGQFGLDLDKLTLEGGVINLADGVQIGADTMEGSGGTLNLGTNDGQTQAALNVGQLDDKTKLDVNLMNADLTKELTSDDLTPEQTQELLKNVADGSANVTTDVAEGQYNDGYSANGKDGVVATTKNSIMSNTLDLASSAPLAMNRLLMNDVRKRMGDLRAAEGTHGVWARYDGGKLSGERGLENDFTTVQVGIDTVPVVDAPRFGVAFAYTKSDADMLRGSADMDAFSLAFYGTKFYDNGMFVDVIGRMATADTDVTVEGQKGTMDNVALSLSGELGWRFDVTEKFYFEPQAELTYTYVNADKLALGNSSYEFDSVDSLMARVGFAAGFKCPSNFGDVYVRASAVHEFLGDSAVTGGNGTIHEVDGEDTWVEFGIGANFNINKNTYVYADIERTEGAKLEEDWRANVGVRFAF